jgi:hypothetical protein
MLNYDFLSDVPSRGSWPSPAGTPASITPVQYWLNQDAAPPDCNAATGHGGNILARHGVYTCKGNGQALAKITCGSLSTLRAPDTHQMTTTR